MRRRFARVSSGSRCTVTLLPNFLGWIDFLGYGASNWARDQIKYQRKTLKTTWPQWIEKWARDTVRWWLSAYTLVWQLPINFIRMANIRINRLRLWVRHIRPACSGKCQILYQTEPELTLLVFWWWSAHVPFWQLSIDPNLAGQFNFKRLSADWQPCPA